jgi:hypothetical protein
VQKVESSASLIRHQGSTRDDGDAQGSEASVHAGGVAGQPANQGRTLIRERILTTRGQAQDGDNHNVINTCRTGNTETQAVVSYHTRQGGRYDSCEDCSPAPEPPGTCVFSREIRTASFPQRFCQPTSIDKYTGEMDHRVWLNNYRLACQLGGATTNEVIIHNLPLHLADSARTWLQHLRPVRSITGMMWCARSWETSKAHTCALGTPGTCGRAPRSPASLSRTSYGASPSVARSSRA